MSVQEDTIDRAIEMATKGSSEEAVELLRPLVRGNSDDHQALFALAYCFEKGDTLTTAVYIYEKIVEKHPDFDVAAGHLENCRRELEARGLSEDLQDAGHIDCPCGAFRQRAEYGACPYCGSVAGEPEQTSPVLVDDDRRNLRPLAKFVNGPKVKSWDRPWINFRS